MATTIFCLIFLLSSTSAATVSDWIEPEHWADVGTVQEWTRIDSHFYRIEGLTVSTAASQYKVDQREIYTRTRRNRSGLVAVELATFRTLPTAEQSRRRDAARDELRTLQGFRHRMVDLVMRIQGQIDVAWGNRTGDPKVVGEHLEHLQTATGLDPTNPYVWHLLAYFSDLVGDRLRALDALDALDAALALIPDDALLEMRRRAALDRAWLLRDAGYFEQAAEALAEAAGDRGRDQEMLLLHGLIAAQTGDMHTAMLAAGELDGVALPVFQRDWEASTLAPAILDPLAWSTRPSAHLKAWVLATAWLCEGDTAMATAAFPKFPRDRHYGLGHRFWNEAGVIYEMTGRRELAMKAWSLATIYLPWHPYLIHKPYGLDLQSITGRPGDLPFMLGFDTFFVTGSRLAYGSALVSQSVHAAAREEQVSLAEHAAAELEICLRSGLDKAPAALMLGQANAVLGIPFEMLRAADAGLAALARPDQDQTGRAALENLRRVALAEIQVPGMEAHGRWLASPQAWKPGEDPQVVEARLRALHAEDPDDDVARRDLARFLIRHGDPIDGAALAEAPLDRLGDPPLEDLVLILEVDRLRNDPTRARQLLELLLDGRGDRWPDPRLWILVGFICQDHGLPRSRVALERALELGPDNLALKKHLDATVY